MVILKGYLKALKSIGTTTTQDGKTLISNTFVNIEALPSDEAKKVEEALDRVFAEVERMKTTSSVRITPQPRATPKVETTLPPGSRYAQARDSVRKSNVSQIATALQRYHTDKGNYPVSLNELITSGDLRSLPKVPDGANYGYLRCNNGQEAAVFSRLEESGTYWVWSSIKGIAKDTRSSTVPTTCDIK